MVDEILFKVTTPLGFSVRVTYKYWQTIVQIKHPVMYGRETDVQAVLKTPDEIRKSLSDPAVFLFYRLEREGRWLCAVTKRLNGDGFVITAYPTDAIKEGTRIWHK